MDAGHWRPTAAHARAVLGTLAIAAAAVLARRPDLIVVVSPLAAAATWGAALRPSREPVVSQRIGHRRIGEGQATRWYVTVDDLGAGVDTVAADFGTPPWIELEDGRARVVIGRTDDRNDPVTVSSVIRPIRWGQRQFDPARVSAVSAWGAFRWTSAATTDRMRLGVLPQRLRFDAIAPTVRAPGLVGVNRSTRAGSGTEFASIRTFRPGDRLRRIHWPTSLRTGELHIAATWADHDRHMLLLVEALDDVGQSQGIDGRASSLDISVRATAAIADHFVRVADRVAVVTIGTGGVRRLPPATGRRHLERILDSITRLEPAKAHIDDGRLPPGITGASVVVMLSPLLSDGSLRRSLGIADQGLPVIAVDCLPPDIGVGSGDPYERIAWRIELLRRERRLRRLRSAGIPVVQWHGPGSLDLVLRSLHRSGRMKVRR